MPVGEESWFPEAIDPTALGTLRHLRDSSALGGFYLAGGTALALRLGHRRSLDLDFFTAAGFASDRMLERLTSMNRDVTVLSREADTLHARIDSAKVSFLAYPRGHDLWPVENVKCPWLSSTGADALGIPD